MSCKVFYVISLWLPAWALLDMTGPAAISNQTDQLCTQLCGLMPVFFVFADHCVHYYDLRNTKQPIMVFKGHRKAVSYAKFVSGEEIVSA